MQETFYCRHLCSDTRFSVLLTLRKPLNLCTHEKPQRLWIRGTREKKEPAPKEDILFRDAVQRFTASFKLRSRFVAATLVNEECERLQSICSTRVERYSKEQTANESERQAVGPNGIKREAERGAGQIPVTRKLHHSGSGSLSRPLRVSSYRLLTKASPLSSPLPARPSIIPTTRHHYYPFRVTGPVTVCPETRVRRSRRTAATSSVFSHHCAGKHRHLPLCPHVSAKAILVLSSPARQADPCRRSRCTRSADSLSFLCDVCLMDGLANDRSADGSDLLGIASVADALQFLRRTFPVSSFTDKIPPIIWRHLLYALPALGSRTQINRTLVIRIISMIRVSLLTCSGWTSHCW